MTRTQAVGVLLIVLCLVYTLLYAAWRRKARRHPAAAVVVDHGDSGDGAGGADAPGSTLSAEGTYVSTTTAASRHERVAVEGLGNRARATLTVHGRGPEQLVRLERQGEATVVIPHGRLVDVRRDRGMAGKFVGVNRLLVLRWRADDGSLYATGFLPRYRADLERLETALSSHRDGHARPSAPDGRTSGGTFGRSTPDGSTPHHPSPSPTREGDPRT